MGWASGSQVADDLWNGLKDIIPEDKRRPSDCGRSGGPRLGRNLFNRKAEFEYTNPELLRMFTLLEVENVS